MDCLIQTPKRSEQGIVQDAQPKSTVYSVPQYQCDSGEGYSLRYLDFEQSMRFSGLYASIACLPLFWFLSGSGSVLAKSGFCQLEPSKCIV
jgi:hypothetical protein